MIKKFIKRSMFFITASCLLTFVAQAQSAKKSPTAYQAAGKFEHLDLEGLPVWNENVYKKRFKEIRDKKFLMYQGEERRVPWLYVRDGCHMRSAHFIRESERLGYEPPQKVFVFGSLEIKGAIVPHGSVEPQFHAAPIVQVNGQAMVLDPSINFTGPLPLEKWISYIAKDRDKLIYASI